MSRLSRRSLLTGAASAGALLALNHVTPGRLVRAQGAAYTIVSFGPMTEGVREEGDFIPNFGGITGIHASGTAFGNLASSAEKFTPTLFMPDGSVSKLKSGKFGGDVRAMNAAGRAVGVVFETDESRETWNYEGLAPALWIDSELTRLPLPDPKEEYSDLGGMAIAISDSGSILGEGNGHAILWVDGEAQTLPTETPLGESIEYLALTPDSTLIAQTSSYDSVVSKWIYRPGVVEAGEFKALELPEDTLTGAIPTASTNSANDLLFRFFPTDLPFNVIIAKGSDPIILDHRKDGVYFTSYEFNASHVLVGSLQMRAGDDFRPALLQDGEFTFLEDLLPADHGFSRFFANGIADDGTISGGGYDVNGDFHPLLFVPA